jgi:hypothetical protein
MNAKVSLLAVIVSFTLLVRPAAAISGGEPDGNRHPNVGTVIAYDSMLDKIVPYLSGTLIHERVLLTAGHGMPAIESGEVTLLGVSFDEEVDMNDPSTWLPVTGFAYSHGPVHGVGGEVLNIEGADPKRTDIAVLILEEPITSIAPATLPAAAGLLDDLKQDGLLQAGPNGTMLTVVGYGRGLAFPPPTQTPAISPDGYAHRRVAQTGYLGLNAAWLSTSQNLAAGYGGTLSGDSGGPVFWTDPDTSEEILVAITAWGGSLIGNGFYYRIDTADSLAFIQDAIDSLEAE